MQSRTHGRARSPLRTAGALLMASLASTLGGCPGNTAPTPQEGVTDVAMIGMAFVPKEITIRVGESVRWTNNDFVPHTVTSGNPGDADAGSQFDSGLMGRGATFQRQFNAAGEYIYFCLTHPTTPAMRDAKVLVQP